jgi:Cytochrome P460
LAIEGYTAGILPFPDGAMFAKLVWKRLPSTEFNGAFVPGTTTTVQFMVKRREEIPLDRRGFRPIHQWQAGR